MTQPPERPQADPAAAGVPTARARTVSGMAAGLAALDELGLPVAVKADGLAAGKG